MSSRDIGPALPPHLRRNHRNTDEDLGGGSSGLYEYDRNSKHDRHRTKHREKYSERERKTDSERERRTDRERDVSRRDRYRESDRSSGHATERNRGRYRDTREVEKRVSCRGKDERHQNSSKRSKRSKTDRTYNTDTEESSDGRSDIEDWPKVAESDSSDSEQEDESKGARQVLDQPLPVAEPVKEGKPSSTDVPADSLPDNDFMTPSSPPHLIKDSTNPNSDSVGYDSSPIKVSPPESSKNSHSSVGIGPALPPHLKAKSTTGSDTYASIGPTPSLMQKSQFDQTDVEEPTPYLKKLGSELHLHDESDQTNIVGPALPPHLKKPQHSEMHIGDESNQTSIVGPALPPHLKKPQHSEMHLDDESDQTDIVGPAPPPHLLKAVHSKMHSDKSSVIGPALGTSSVVGPTLPPGMDIVESSGNLSDASSEEDIVGPLLPEQMARSGKNLMVQAQLERNAAAVRRKLEGKELDDNMAVRREEWMLALPPESTVDLGLGPRTFRARGAPEKGADRSGWTDTPADKARKEEEAKQRFELGNTSTADVKKEALSRELSSKDKSMEAVVKKHKRSKESLLDSHQKKIKEEKKKKEKAGAKQERRPFNRDIDLKANVFDDAQKKAIYKKAQFLDSRFSSGESKYL